MSKFQLGCQFINSRSPASSSNFITTYYMDQGKKKKGLCVVFILGPLKQKHSREKVRQGGAHMAKSLYANKLMKSED